MKLSDIKGIGQKRIEALNDAGFFAPEDLVLHYPQDYYEICKVKPSLLSDQQKAVVFVKIEKNPQNTFVKKGFSYIRASVLCNGEVVQTVWFNQRYMINTLKEGKELLLLIKVKKTKNTTQLVVIKHINEYFYDKQIIPIYKNIVGLPANVFLNALKTVFSHVKIDGYFNEDIYSRHNLMRLNDAIFAMHEPSNLKTLEEARKTVSLEDLSYKMACFSLIKEEGLQKRVFLYESLDYKKDFFRLINFELTNDQVSAMSVIEKSLMANEPLNLMIEGDVGSGKTVVAFYAMFLALKNGYQSVLMAPTEILAKQHYINAVKLFGNLANIQLLTGSMSKPNREDLKNRIANGGANLIIGTHSLISEDVIYNKLALVITDEQQRFGVKQRAELENKSLGCDKIVMTATPIPRTLALSLYGDLEKVEIREMPKNKAKIETRFVKKSKIPDMLNYLHIKAANGEKTFMVLPRIDDDENGGMSAVEFYNELKSKFSDVGIGLIHGQIKNKQEVMEDFSQGKIMVLVATTVVEVGIDIPEATSIVIFDAHYYGLSQLHQLRGRVGRGKTDSFCFITSDASEEKTLERLNYFCKTNNGFELAEYDFFNRGAGDFMGTRQHGETPIKISKEILEEASAILKEILNDFELKQKIKESISKNSVEYIRNIALN